MFSGEADPRALIDALGKAAGERRLLVYSDRVNEQKQLAASSVGGALPGDAAPFAGLATINGGGNKLDYYLGQSLTYELIGCTPDGGRRGQITVTYENTAPGDGSLPLYVAARGDLPLGPDGAAAERERRPLLLLPRCTRRPDRPWSAPCGTASRSPSSRAGSRGTPSSSRGSSWGPASRPTGLRGGRTGHGRGDQHLRDPPGQARRPRMPTPGSAAPTSRKRPKCR